MINILQNRFKTNLKNIKAKIMLNILYYIIFNYFFLFFSFLSALVNWVKPEYQTWICEAVEIKLWQSFL